MLLTKRLSKKHVKQRWTRSLLLSQWLAVSSSFAFCYWSSSLLLCVALLNLSLIYENSEDMGTSCNSTDSSVFHRRWEKPHHSVMHDSLHYINILTYLHTKLCQYSLFKLHHLWQKLTEYVFQQPAENWRRLHEWSHTTWLCNINDDLSYFVIELPEAREATQYHPVRRMLVKHSAMYP